MNNQQLLLFVGILIEEDDNRNFMRLIRRQLRDDLNPFEVPDNRFKQFFRLDRRSTIDLINSLEQIPNNISTSIPLYVQVLTTLHFTATGSFQNSIGSNSWISLSQTSVSRCINNICSLISNHLLPIWIQFPITREKKHDIILGFYDKWQIRGVIGAIDGTHCEIIAPPINDQNHPPFVYINRKGKHSLNVILISDSDGRILACSARYPGSVHDSAIWQTSSIKNYLRAQYEAGNTSYHLIGDSGYPLEPWLFTPFPNPADGTVEARFNQQLNSARNVIERTNGMLKGRFRCCSRFRVLMYHPTKAANIINTCCVLHNIALHYRIPFEEEEIEYRNDDVQVVNEDRNIDNNVLQLGRDARNQYIRENFM